MSADTALSVSKLSLSVAPSGQIHLDPEPQTPESAPAYAMAAPLAQRLRKAHAAGPGSLLLHLGTTELTTPLPPDFGFFRELCRRFLTALCATPDLEEQRARVTVPPPADLGELAGTAPPMRGAEYLDGELLGRLWDELLATVRAELLAATGSVQEYLAGKNRLWNLVGRVCFHLVENKRNPEVPFAFLATYASRLSGQAQVAHLPLGKALAEYSEGVKKDKGALLALLSPVQKAASRSPFVRKLVDSGELFQPLGFTPAEAYAFLKDVPALEESGVVVRVPDFWQARKPPRPQVSVTIGKNAAATLSADALLDFSISLTVDGQPISDAEWQEILRGLYRGTVPARTVAAPVGVVSSVVVFDPPVEPARREWFIRGTETDKVGMPRPAAHILHPAAGSLVDGMALADDPAFRIRFEASPALPGLSWRLDGERIGRGAHLAWTPVAGLHTLELLAADDRVLDTVTFAVRAPLP